MTIGRRQGLHVARVIWDEGWVLEILEQEAMVRGGAPLRRVPLKAPEARDRAAAVYEALEVLNQLTADFPELVLAFPA